MLSGEYASILHMARELVDSTSYTISLAAEGGRRIASNIRAKKQMFEHTDGKANFRPDVHQALLSNTITTLIFIEIGKCLLVQASQEEFKTEAHEILLDEVSGIFNTR